MSEANQTESFTERVDVSTQPDGAFIGTLEIDVQPGDHQQDRVASLLVENSALRDRLRQLERANADLRTQQA